MKFKEAQKHAVAMFKSSEFLKSIREEDPRMVRQIPILQEINAKGFLTQNSQAGHFQKGISALNKKPYEMSERAYLGGFLKLDHAETFLKEMALRTDKNAIVIPVCDSIADMPSSLDIPLTLLKSQGKVTITTHMSAGLPKSTYDSFRKGVHLNASENVVYVFCWDTNWNRLASGGNGLFRDVLRCL